MRKVLIGLAGLAVLLVVAALIVPSMIDWNGYRGQIAAQVESLTGRRLVIDGDLDLSVLPTLRLSVNGARLANIEGASAPDMLTLKSFGMRIRFAPLLRGRVEVESVTLEEPVILLETLADGRANWELAPARAGGGAPVAPPSGAAQPDSAADADTIQLDSLRIVNGTLVYRDARSGTIERIERMNLEIGAQSLAGPFRAEGTLLARKIPLKLEGAIGRITESAATPANLRVDVDGTKTRLEVAATVAETATAPRVSGRVKLAGDDLAGLIVALGGAPATASLPPWLAQSFTLDGRIKATAKEAAVSDLQAELGEVRAKGALSAEFGERVSAKAEIGITRIDLDSWLAMKPKAEATGGAKRSGRVTTEASSPPSAPAPFALPRGVNATVDVTVGAVKYRDGLIRDAKLAAALNEGEVTLNQLTARLPGEAEASLFGFLAARAGKPHFDGTVEARADNLRAVLQWLQVDVTSVPADRLRKFTLAGKVQSDGDQVQFLDGKIALDTSHIRGGVTLALRERLAFGASVDLNHLNLDAYLRPPVAMPGRDAAPSGDAAKAAPGSPAGAPLAVLNDFDANLRLRIGSLTWRQTAAQGINIDGTLAGGTLTLRRAGVRSLGGTRAGITGTLSGFKGFPVFRGVVVADAKDLTGLVRIAGVNLPVPAAQLGAMRLSGRFDGGADEVKLSSRLALAGGTVTLDGDLSALQAAPRIDATLNLSHPELSSLLRVLGQDPGRAGRNLGALTLTGKVAGDMKAIKLDAEAKTAGSVISLAGTVSDPAAAPRFDLAFKANHPDYRALVRTFDPDAGPAGGAIGPVALAAELKGDASRVTLGNLKARVGEIAVSGDGALALDGKRPKLSATLTGNDIVIDPFLAPGRAGPPRPAAPGAAPPPPSSPGLSDQPFDSALAPLGALDADIALSARSVTYRQFRVDSPEIKAVIEDRVLDLKRLAGKMFDGAFALDGKLDARARPALEGRVKVTRANVGNALFQAAAFDILGGILDFDMSVNGSGASPRALAASLGGSGRIAVENGVVKGFDLSAVSNRLKNIDRGLDILKLFGAAMGGGSTRFSRLDGSFKIDKGVLKTDDLKLIAEAGEGRGRGSADLARWTMDFNTEFHLTEHPKVPPFGMVVRGPIDNPQRIFRIDALQAYLVQRGVSGLLKRVLPRQAKQPGQKAPPQPAQEQAQPAQPAQPQSTRPEDILRGLLDRLKR